MLKLRSWSIVVLLLKSLLSLSQKILLPLPMQLSKCLHPVRVKDYVGNYRYVPCGQCEACRSLKAYMWKKRLDTEVNYNQYTLAFTLTYDEVHVPRVLVNSNTGYCSLNYIENKPTTLVSKDIIDDLLKNGYKKRLDGNIEVLTVCHYDLQLFIKQLRFYVENFRFYIQSEIGPSTLRPHYHGLLFFNCYSPEYVKESILKAWTKCDWSVPQHRNSIHLASNTSYCTSYVSSVLLLPKFHNFKRFAQFHYCSTRPPIGSFVYDKQSIESFSRGETFNVPEYDIASNSYTFKPFIRCMEDKYFGKLPYNFLLNSSSRKFLYMSYRYFAPRWPLERVNSKVYKFSAFASAFSKFLEDYPALFSETSLHLALQSDSSLYRIYQVSKNYALARLCSHPLYVDYCIDMHNYRIEMAKLKEQYEYEIDFIERRKLSPKWLIFKDAEFVRTWSNAFGVVPYWVRCTLFNYGYLSIEDFTANWQNYALEKNVDCQAYFKRVHDIIHESHKTKANRSYQLKNKVDYLDYNMQQISEIKENSLNGAYSTSI